MRSPELTPWLRVCRPCLSIITFNNEQETMGLPLLISKKLNKLNDILRLFANF